MPADAHHRSLSTRTASRPAETPLYALTTFELSGYRRQLESAIAFLGAKNPVPEKLDTLQAKLDDVLAEEESRRRLADA